MQIVDFIDRILKIFKIINYKNEILATIKNSKGENLNPKDNNLANYYVIDFWVEEVNKKILFQIIVTNNENERVQFIKYDNLKN